MSELHYETLLVRREGLTRDLPAGDNEDLRWVANSATLISGDHDAVLVDTFTTIEQNERLIDWVKVRGRDLTHLPDARPRRPRLRHRAAAAGFPRRPGGGDRGNGCRGAAAGQRAVPGRILGSPVPRPDPAAGDSRRTGRRHHRARGTRAARHRGGAHRHHRDDGAVVPGPAADRGGRRGLQPHAHVPGGDHQDLAPGVDRVPCQAQGPRSPLRRRRAQAARRRRRPGEHRGVDPLPGRLQRRRGPRRHRGRAVRGRPAQAPPPRESRIAVG